MPDRFKDSILDDFDFNQDVDETDVSLDDEELELLEKDDFDDCVMRRAYREESPLEVDEMIDLDGVAIGDYFDE